ncbi:MAG: hypothetical protein WCJ37_01140 [Syntrophus sp. (in: bacteria)]
MLLSNRAYAGSNPGKLYSFTNAVTTDWALYTNKNNWCKAGMLRNFHCGDAVVSGLTDRASQPAGNTHPVAYVLAQKPGRISSHALAVVSLSGEGSAAKGSLVFTKSCAIGLAGSATGTLIVGSLIDGSAAIIIDGSAIGAMTLGGAGSAIITVSSNGSILGHVPARGAASIELGAVVNATAVGWLIGNAPITLDGTLASYAVGWLAGSTEDRSVLTAKAVAEAVWSELLSAYDDSGMAGKYLRELGAGADPWASEIEGDHTAQDILRYLLSFIGGKATGGGTANPVFRSTGDVKDRISMTVDENGNRTQVILDGDDE